MVTSPSAGDNITAAWGQSVALATGLLTTSDVTTSSAAFADFTGLSFTCTAGTNYIIEVIGTYQHSTNTGGPILSFTQPGGSHRIVMQLAGETAPDAFNTEAISANDGGAGVATAAAAATRYVIRGFGSYQCTSSGTAKLRIARNTAGTATFEKGFMLRVTGA